MVSEKSSSTTLSSVLPHAAAPDFRSGLSSAGTNRDSFSRGELDRSDPSSLSMPSLMDLVDPDREQGSKGARKGAKKIARERGRHRRGTATSGSTHAQKKSKRNGSSSLQRTSTSRQRRWRKQERSKSPTRKKRKSSKTKRRKAEKAKTKLPSTAPAGRSRRSTMGPLVTTPPLAHDDTLPSLEPTRSSTSSSSVQKEDDDENDDKDENELRRIALQATQNLQDSERSEDEEMGEEAAMLEKESDGGKINLALEYDEKKKKRNRGQHPPRHLMNHAYVRHRDGGFTSYLSSHTVGTFHMDISFAEWRADDDSLFMLAEKDASNNGERLETLNLSGCHDITEAGLSLVLRGATFLTKLNLSGCGSQLTNNVLITVATVCTRMRDLDVSSCTSFSEIGFDAVCGWTRGRQTKGAGLSKLERLSMSNCPLLSDVTLGRIAKGCSELRALDVSQCPNITDDGLRDMIDNAKHLRELLSHDNERVSGQMFAVDALSHDDCSLFVCCGLRSVGMRGCRELDDSKLIWLAQSCALLESLEISDCPLVSTRGLMQMIEKCPRLVSLSVLGCGQIYDGVGSAITNVLTNIMSLDLAGASNLTASSLALLIQKCRQLRHINLSGVPKLSDGCFVGEAEVDRNMELLRQDPRYADTARTPVRSIHVGDAPLLTNKGFSAIAWLFRHAVIMDFSGCAQFGNTALYHVTENCRAVTNLNLSGCDMITDVGVKRISSRCQKLETLNLSVNSDSPGCRSVGNKSLSALLGRLRLLRTLELQNRVLITGTTQPSGPAFRAKMLRHVNFAGCTDLRLTSVRSIVAECPEITMLELTRCRIASKRKRSAIKELIHLLPHPELMEAVFGRTFCGLRCVPYYGLRRCQLHFHERFELEHASALKLQVRWREWKVGSFTLMYLIIWTKNLRRKGKVDTCAITIQKYYRRKLGARLAWERRRVVMAERIQRNVRAWISYKKDFTAHMRVASCIRLQQWWRRWLYMKISLRDRIWECVQVERRKQEAESRKHEQLYFAARAMQCWYRRIRSVRLLNRLKRERKNAIFGSALIVPSKRWSRSKVHAPGHAQFIDRTVIRFGNTEGREEEEVTKRRPSTAPAAAGAAAGAAGAAAGAAAGTAADVNDVLRSRYEPKIAGTVMPEDVQQVRRYPGRYCQRCTTRHAVVRCAVCLWELCPRCNVELHVVDRHGNTAKYAHHPERKSLLVVLPKDMRLEQSITVGRSAWEDSEWVLRPIMRVRDQRLAMHDELMVAIARREEMREKRKEEEKRKRDLFFAKCFSIFGAHWHGIIARRAYPIMKENVVKAKVVKKNQHVFKSASHIQALFRGYSLRIWYMNLRMDDPYLFWRDVHIRESIHLPGVTRQQWGISQKILEEDFVNVLSKKGRSFKARFGTTVRRYIADIKVLATKVQDLHGESGVYLKRWACLMEIGKKTPLSSMAMASARELKSQGRRLEALAQGFGSIMILMKQRLVFLTDRRAYEDRRDAVLRAQKKAFDMARENIEKVLKETKETVKAIEKAQEEPAEDWDAMNSKAEAIIAHAEKLENPYKEAEEVLEPRMADEEFHQLTDEEKHEYETMRILKEQEIKERIEKAAKAKERRSMDRLKLWKAQWSKRNAWLRKEHKHALHKAIKGEMAVLSMAKALVETREEEIRLYQEYDTVQEDIIQSIQAEIHYEAEIMQLEVHKQMLEANEGEGALGILESVRHQVNLRDKQRRLHDDYSQRVLQCIHDSDEQTERRERFVVSEWSETKGIWAVVARPQRFELAFSSDHWAMSLENWMDEYSQKPWVDFMQSGKEESENLKKMNDRFGNALTEAQQEQKEKEDAESQAKALEDAKEAATQAIVKKQKADIKVISTKYGNVLSNLLTDVSPELAAAREKERRNKMSRAARWKEDAYNFVMGPTIRKRVEMRRVQESIEHRQKASVGYVEAICGFHITTGAETKKFEANQEPLKLDNKPHYRMVPDNLGREWSVYLWIMKTIDQPTMITNVVIGSSVTYNKKCYLEPAKLLEDGYDRSNEIPTEGEGSCQLVVWAKADPLEKLVLHDIAVSFTDKTEKFLREDGYKRLDPDLGDLRMPPDARIWCKYGGRERDKVSKAQDETYYLDKIQGYQEVLKEEPDNPVVVKKIARLNEDLRQFRLNEENKKKNKLRNMVEFLALSEIDMKKMSAHFADIDSDNSGEIDLTEFFDYLEIDRTAFTDSLFAFLDESNDGTIDFAEFVHACGTICMWEIPQVLQFMFSMYDTAGNGYIIESQLQSLLLAVGGDDPINLTGNERVMAKFDKDGDGRVDWDEFQKAASRFPSAFIPAFKLLDQWRKKVMGTAFWKRKKLIFMKVRENMAVARQEAALEGKKQALAVKREKDRQRKEALEKDAADKAAAAASKGPGSPNSEKNELERLQDKKKNGEPLSMIEAMALKRKKKELKEKAEESTRKKKVEKSDDGGGVTNVDGEEKKRDDDDAVDLEKKKKKKKHSKKKKKHMHA